MGSLFPKKPALMKTETKITDDAILSRLPRLKRGKHQEVSKSFSGFPLEFTPVKKAGENNQ